MFLGQDAPQAITDYIASSPSVRDAKTTFVGLSQLTSLPTGKAAVWKTKGPALMLFTLCHL